MADGRRRAFAAWPDVCTSGIDRIQYLEALVLLPLIAASLRTFGLSRTRSWLRRLPGRSRRLNGEHDAGQAARCADVVTAAAATGPYRPSCLRRALALEAVLRQRSLASELKLGVRQGTGVLDAHAWVEHNGVPLATGPDPDQDHESYSVLASFAAER